MAEEPAPDYQDLIPPAPDHEDFDVAFDQGVAAEIEYARCKEIWMDALEEAHLLPDERAFHLETALEYFRAANQIRYRYQSHYKDKIDDDDILEDWPEPIHTPAGLVMPSFETVFDVNKRLYEYLCEHYPHLAAHFSGDTAFHDT